MKNSEQPHDALPNGQPAASPPVVRKPAEHPSPAFLLRLQQQVAEETARLYGSGLVPADSTASTRRFLQKHVLAVSLTAAVLCAWGVMAWWSERNVDRVRITLQLPDVDKSAARPEPVSSEHGMKPGAANVSADPSHQRDLVQTARPFRVVGPEGAVCLSYDDLEFVNVMPHATVWNSLETPLPPQSGDLPNSARLLDGQRVRIRGFMVPDFQESGLRAFLLARDNEPCCFGRNPRPCDVIHVALRNGKTTRYISGRPFDVVGVFAITPGEQPTTYQLSDAIVVARD